MSVEQLEVAAEALGELVDDVVFLSGATVGLWFTDPAARPARVTVDVDVVAEVFTPVAYGRFQAALRDRGFAGNVYSGVICRWRHPATELILDAVPAEPRLAGLSGHWLGPSVAAAVDHQLPSAARIRVVPPAWLTVLKLEASVDRGNDETTPGDTCATNWHASARWATTTTVEGVSGSSPEEGFAESLRRR